MGQVSLYLHPWALPFEGLLVGAEEEEEAPPKGVDPQVEVPREEWGPLPPGDVPPFPAVLFVDGVRRVDAGVVSQDAHDLYWGLFGSYGVGGVLCRRGEAQVVAEEVRRSLVLGGGQVPEVVRVPCGSAHLEYQGVLSRNQQQEVRGELQRLMREQEGHLLSRLGDGSLVVVDGPLTFQVPREAPVVGYIKSHHRRYLDAQLMRVALSLPPGTRTPLFLIRRERGPDRLSCYARVALAPSPGHPLVGIVRLEMWASLGVEAAARLAGLAVAVIPRFASASQWDPRAPVNLYPVAALEERLRHRLGDHQWVRRGIAQYLYRQEERL